MSEQTADHPLHINEVASYLYSHDEPLRNQLLNDPEISSEMLDPGEEMGTEEEIPINRKSLLAQCKVIAASLESAQVKAQDRTAELQKKVLVLRRLRFVTALGSAVTAGVTSISATLGNTPTTLIASLATFFGTVANAAASTFVLGQNGTESEVLSLIQDLEEARTFAEVSSKYLVTVADGDYPMKEAAALVREANVYFGKLVSALNKSAKYVPSTTDKTHQDREVFITTKKA